jgi:hypothetical protein
MNFTKELNDMNFSNVIIKPSITDIPHKRAVENNLHKDIVAKAVMETAKASEQLSVKHLSGPVSAVAGANNFEIVIGKNFEGRV